MKLFTLLIFLSQMLLYAVGPNKVATFERSLWNESIASKPLFDKASRHEIISYVNQIILTNLSSKSAIKKFIEGKRVNVNSVKNWKEFTKEILLQNFKNAQKTCTSSLNLCKKVNTWSELSILARDYKPSMKQLKWYRASQTFFSYYLYEQVRLAALFPKTTSEIAKLDASEVQGVQYEDGEFLLTFDDGPKYKRTNDLVNMLRENQINGLFFVLGNNLDRALKKHGKNKIQKLYEGSCVGSHGFIHKSHQRLKSWQSSYDKTRDLITRNNLQNTLHNKVWFRPPYGQRHQRLITYLAKKNDRVMLWNIDSQDWNRKMSAKNIEDRVLTLMLLHRKGIILFHDIHPKAIKVVKALNSYRTKDCLQWVDCRGEVE